MKVSVILPTFNREKFLKRSIESVLNQTYGDFELIVVNDGSTDNTEAVLKEYVSHPNFLILNQENKGVSSARNLGIKKSTSPLVAFIDSDDEWLPQKLDIQVKDVKENPSYRFFHSNEFWIRNGIQVNIPKKFDKSNHNIFERSLESCLISPSTTLLKRELLMEVGFFDEELIICEDYDFWLRILAKEQPFHQEKFLIKKYGGHSDQLSTKYFAMDFWRVKSLIKLLECHTEKEELIQKVLSNKLSLLIKGYLKHENFEELEKLKELVLKSSKLDWTSIFTNRNHNE